VERERLEVLDVRAAGVVFTEQRPEEMADCPLVLCAAEKRINQLGE
jgi:hypothetical protein